MPPPYNNPHWQVFSAYTLIPAGNIGIAPSKWVQIHRLSGIPTASIPIPTHQLNRTQVRAICTNPAIPVLFGYICSMAWGSQGAGPGGSRYVKQAWGSNQILANHLGALRGGGLSRGQAYNLFLKTPVPGLGPAYWTKLLYFFSPTPDFYIMDQWTAKSINLLTNNKVVRMVGNAVSNFNKKGNYEAYCYEVDEIARLMGISGEQAEEMLVSKGGRNRWPWRCHVVYFWKNNKPKGRYNASAMNAKYPHIPLADF